MTNLTPIFLTIGIQTYNRAFKLERLLNQFLTLNTYFDVKQWNLEILISDNCSNDSTPLVVSENINKLIANGYIVSSYRQPKNLGLDGNSLFVLDHANGIYLWFFSDDDILIPNNVLNLLEDLKAFQPGLCLSNFIQFPYTDSNPIFLKKSNINEKILLDPVQSIKAIMKWPKLTNYILKKSTFVDEKFIEKYDKLLESCNGKFYLFIAFALMAYFSVGTVLIRKASIAKCDDDYLNLEYSPRVFQNLNMTVKESLVFLGKEKYIDAVKKQEKPSNMVRNSMIFLILHYQGKINLPNKILDDEEAFLKNTSPFLYLHPLCVLPYLKMNFLLFLKKLKKS